MKNYKSILFYIFILSLISSTTYCQKKKSFSKYEITNEEFREFLTANNIAFDTCNTVVQWNKVNNYTENNPLVNNYRTHPAFNNYPATNVSLELAKEYCKWLTNKKKRKRKKIRYRLPLKSEYEEYVILNNRSDYLEDYSCKDFMSLKYLSNKDDRIHFSADGAMYTIDVNKTKKEKGIHGILGNVSELTNNGEAVGGNWNTFPSEIFKEKEYKSPDPRIGFRIIKEKIN